jgi:hypothetical protein
VVDKIVGKSDGQRLEAAGDATADPALAKLD